MTDIANVYIVFSNHLVALGRVTDPDNLRVVAPKQPGDAVVNVVYMDVLEVGEARCSTQVG